MCAQKVVQQFYHQKEPDSKLDFIFEKEEVKKKNQINPSEKTSIQNKFTPISVAGEFGAIKSANKPKVHNSVSVVNVDTSQETIEQKKLRKKNSAEASKNKT